MTVYAWLLLAIVFEVVGTMMLPAAESFTRKWPAALCLFSYSLCVYILSVVSTKLPLPVIYATWCGLGIFFVTVLSAFIYKQTINIPTALGLVLIVLGVIVVGYFKESSL